jgi:glucose-1-phosphate cytidylyltransferase
MIKDHFLDFQVRNSDLTVDLAGGTVAFHRKSRVVATLTAVRPPARYGNLVIGGGGYVDSFVEKPQTDAGWISGGFFVFEPAIFDVIDGDQTALEREPLERLTVRRDLAAFPHEGFWQAMDTLRERRLLEELWASGRTPWKVCNDLAPV